MDKPKVLYISQEIMPYLPESPISEMSRNLPQGIQERGREIRTFMPRFGVINERRHQLHEVIRLSGMNLIINDIDHPLIIKVASIQQARMQVYFIDNEEYFKRKSLFTDPETGKLHPDNDERMIFFGRGVLETVKKLGWSPDIIHCMGWMTGLVPLYLKTLYKDDPMFTNSKVVFSVYEPKLKGKLDKDLAQKVMYDRIEEENVELIKDPTFSNVNLVGMQYADAIIKGQEEFTPDFEKSLESVDKPTLDWQTEEEYTDAYADFYDQVMEESSIFAD